MKVLYSWLREFTSTETDPSALAERLTMSGTSIVSVERTAGAYAHMVVGCVLEVHPMDDRLRRCRVAVGPQTIEVVCGAANVRPGLRVAVALPGATLPGGEEIVMRSFAGVDSGGMLLSLAELELAPPAETDGIWEMDDPAEPGVPLATAIGADDYVLEAEITHNRGDCLSVLGIAREVAALEAGRVQVPRGDPPETDSPVGDHARVTVESPELCPRYVGRVVQDLRIAPSPLWLAVRLHLVGARPVNNVVDVTNYVLLELGQPLHAFDLDEVPQGRVVVRVAAGEPLVTLDGVERRLPAGCLAICDRARPIAVAGIMGGRDTEISPRTRRVLLESAHFDHISIRRTAKALGLTTEASYRFERGIDPDGLARAASRAARLLAEVAGGRVARGALDCVGATPTRREIEMRPRRVNNLLGAEIPPAAMTDILRRLDMEVSGADPFRVGPPSYRWDLAEEADLAEEIARLYGYDRLPSRSAIRRTVARQATPRTRLAEMTRCYLVGQGFHEAMTVSLLEEARVRAWLAATDRPEDPAVRVKNPVSEALSTLRPSLLPGLLQSLVLNLNRHRQDPRLFELGMTFTPVAGSERPEERWRLGCVLAGAGAASSWDRAAGPADFFDLRGVVEGYFSFLGLPPPRFRATGLSLFQGRLAREMIWEGESLGFLGEVGSPFRREWGIRQEALVLEMDLERLAAGLDGSRRLYRGLPRTPAVERDVAVVVDAAVRQDAVERLIREEGGELLEALRLFDCYEGDPLPPGHKSLAYTLTLRSPERTLTEEDAWALRERIAERLKREWGASLRE